MSYDAGVNGKGRLTGMSDETGSSAFSYDPHGRLTHKTQTTTQDAASLTHALGLSYDPAGRLVQTSYPSGAVLTTAHDLAGRPLEIRVNGQVLVSDIVYPPFGAPKSWTWGNGQAYTRSFDADGRLKQYPVGSDTRTLGFDAAGRIVSASHANAALNRSYGYDAADRLTQETDNIGVSLWTYDLNSNRMSAQLGSSTYAYAYPATSNRLLSVAGPVPKTYSHDAAGNITSDATTTYTYNAAGRLSKAVRSGQTNEYKHNALGQRVIKTGSYLANGPYRFIYDEQGHLVGEYDKDNQPRQETVWLGDTPVAVLKKDAGGQLQTYAIHADHLNTPRAIVDGQNRVVWRWLGSAFGQGLPEEDPDGDGIPFEYNLRFPGQYYDRETGLHYNYFRSTYDAMMGRYGESDPIGLEGGVNVYAYVSGNPLSYVDFYGLKQFNFFSAEEEPIQYQGANADPDYPNICKVYAHGNSSIIVYEAQGKKKRITLYPIDLNKYLNENGCKNKPVKLYSCNTGSKGPNGQASFGEKLSKLPHRSGVEAPNRSQWFSTDGPNPIPYGHKNNDIHAPKNLNDVGRYVYFP